MTSAVTIEQTREGSRRPSVQAFGFRIPKMVRRVATLTLLLTAAGCGRGPAIISDELRRPIDRSIVEFPAGMKLERYITNLTGPTAMVFDEQKHAVLIAESGAEGCEPIINGYNYDDGTTFRVYPQGKQFFGLRSIPFKMYGPIGGLAVKDGVVYVSHRDKNDMGVISAVTYDGKGTTVIAGLPAQGDYGVTDLQFGPNGRLYFGVGSATNSGVVGLDNWKVGWVEKHPGVADKPFLPTRLRGPRLFTKNPRAGLFTNSELAVTAPLQPFGEYYRSLISGSDKPNSAIYSVQTTGGIAADVIIEAYGVRMPAGLAFYPAEPRSLFASNQGMEPRGSRPVLNDPDTILQVYRRFMGFPDFSTDLRPITDEAFQPPIEMIRPTGYTELNFLWDHPGELAVPFDETDVTNMVRGRFPSLSGASKMAFIPDGGPFPEYSRQLIVALSGDRSPFATSGLKLKGPVGFKVARVDVDRNVPPRDFIANTADVPRSRGGNNPDMLERPNGVKIGPDGCVYVLDLGRVDYRNGRQHVVGRTGKVYRLSPANTPATMPTMKAADPAK